MGLGDVIRTWRESHGLSQAALGKRIGVNDQTISNIEKGNTKTLRSDSLHRFAELSGIPVTELVEASRANGVSGRTSDALGNGPRPPLRRSSGSGGVDSLAMERSASVPEWEIDVAASAWVPVPICELDPNDPQQRRCIELGRFRLRLIGRCMEPDYHSGQSVEFEIIRADRDALQLNADYVVCRNDGLATFKRLVKIDDDTLTLAAVNQREFRGLIVVARQEIVRIARVVYLLQPPPAPAPPKGLPKK